MVTKTGSKLMVMDVQTVQSESGSSTPPDGKKGLAGKGNEDDIDEEGFEPNEVKHNVYDQPSVHGEAGWWDTFFFSWPFKIIQRAKYEQLSIDDFGGLEEGMRVKNTYDRLKYTYESQKTRNLLKAIFWAFRPEYGHAIFLALLSAIFNYAAPFLIKLLIEFIQSDAKGNELGYKLLALLVGSQFLGYMIKNHMTFYNNQIGIISTNSLIAYVY